MSLAGAAGWTRVWEGVISLPTPTDSDAHAKPLRACRQAVAYDGVPTHCQAWIYTGTTLDGTYG